MTDSFSSGLALTAESECAISNIGSGSSRPSIAETAQSLDVASRIPNLENAIDAESHNKQDVFQARVCVGWLHWVVADYGQALNSLPDSLDSIGLENRDSLTEWTSVCAMKSSYLKANCLMRGNHRQAALASFQAGLPSLDRVWNGQPLHSQLKYWSELFLTEYCMLTSESIRDGQNSASKQSSVACFRAWARYWEAMAAPVAGGYGFKGTITSVPRRTIWSEYYQALSKYVIRDETYPPANLGKASADTPARTQLRMELKRVEASYEKLLLSETSFPRANEERTEVEQFIRQVMSNWSILCGRGWSEFDLGQGGRAGISRGVLETLYRAATKTYHSTIILRSLFSVHLSLSEFDLAFKALESYLEIVKKGKARVDKTGILEPSLDDDDTVLETMAQAVMALCLYGQHESAEQARHLGAELEDWLSKVPQARTAEAGTPTAALADGNVNANHYVSPSVIALAWQAIGLSHANWSRATYEASSRTEIQAKAIRCLRKSLASEFGRSKDTRSIFALSLLLAERKDIAAAVELTRSALMARKEPGDAEELYHGPYWQERSLIPLWHLLGLLLSARQEYAMAAKACEGATSQFKDSTILFGKSDSFKSDHLNSAEAKNIAPEIQGGLVDEMDVFEQENLLEVKRTQLALIELQEGPNAAVNASSELLSLFTRLFGNVSVAPGLQPGSSSVSDAPKTARSIRGSIFGSQKDRSRPPTRQVSMATMSDKGTAVPIRPASVQTANPSIQITDEARSPRSRRNSQQSDSGRRNSLKKRNRSESRGRATGNGTQSPQPTVMDGDAFFTPTTEINQLDMMPSNKGPPPAMANFSRDKAVTSLNSYLSKGTEFSDLNLDITHSTPHLLPLVQLPKEKERSRRTAILANVWLTVAGFYRRANMLNECKAAVGEAQKLVQGLESEASRDPATTGAMKPVWAERQTIEELWGSVYSEVSAMRGQ